MIGQKHWLNRILPILTVLSKNKALLGGAFILVLLCSLAVYGLLFVDPSTALVASVRPRLAPGANHWLGTDAQGRDVLTVLLLALPETLKIGLLAGVISLTIGVSAGLIAGYMGGVFDLLIRSSADVMLTIPSIAVLVVIGATVPSMSSTVVAIAVACLSWMIAARAIRAQTLSLKQRAYVEMAILNGLSPTRVVFYEILPNLLPYVLASFVLTVSHAILATVGLEALGLGPKDVLTLGNIIYWSQIYSAILRGMWWWWLPPVFLIGLVFFCLLLISIGLDNILVKARQY